MNAVIDYRPDRGVYRIYMGTNDAGIYFTPAGERKIVALKTGDERPVFVELFTEEYDALSRAILEKESPRLAEASLLQDMLNDTRDVRDRVLTMLEQVE